MLSDVEWLKCEVYYGVKYTVVKNNCEVGYFLSVNAALMNPSLRYVCELCS